MHGNPSSSAYLYYLSFMKLMTVHCRIYTPRAITYSVAIPTHLAVPHAIVEVRCRSAVSVLPTRHDVLRVGMVKEHLSSTDWNSLRNIKYAFVRLVRRYNSTSIFLSLDELPWPRPSEISIVPPGSQTPGKKRSRSSWYVSSASAYTPFSLVLP